MILTGKYCGDAKMASLLKKYEVEFTLHQLYGLLYGAVSAPAVVQPSQVLSVIFNRKEPEFFVNGGGKEFFRECYGALECSGYFNIRRGADGLAENCLSAERRRP